MEQQYRNTEIQTESDLNDKLEDYTALLHVINKGNIPFYHKICLTIEEAARFVMAKFGIKQVLATRSEFGMSLVMKDRAKHIPTKAQEVFDVSGAGDTVIGVFALGLAGGLEPEVSAYMANLAASVVVAKLGTYAVSKEELLEVLR